MEEKRRTIYGTDKNGNTIVVGDTDGHDLILYNERGEARYAGEIERKEKDEE